MTMVARYGISVMSSNSDFFSFFFLFWPGVLLKSWSCHSGLLYDWTGWGLLNTLRPRQNGRHFADNTFKRIFLNENVMILIKISPKFVPKGPINKIPALVQIMAWRRPGDKPLFEPMMGSLQTHICVARPQWVKGLIMDRCMLLTSTPECVVLPCRAITRAQPIDFRAVKCISVESDQPCCDNISWYIQFDLLYYSYFTRPLLHAVYNTWWLLSLDKCFFK